MIYIQRQMFLKHDKRRQAEHRTGFHASFLIKPHNNHQFCFVARLEIPPSSLEGFYTISGKALGPIYGHTKLAGLVMPAMSATCRMLITFTEVWNAQNGWHFIALQPAIKLHFCLKLANAVPILSIHGTRMTQYTVIKTGSFSRHINTIHHHRSHIYYTYTFLQLNNYYDSVVHVLAQVYSLTLTLKGILVAVLDSVIGSHVFIIRLSFGWVSFHHLVTLGSATGSLCRAWLAA